MSAPFALRRVRLAARRPLAWRFRLPALALGLLAGELAAAATASWPRRALVAAALAAPALHRAHRAAGSALLIAAAAALVGLGIGEWSERERGRALAEPPIERAVIAAVIEAVTVKAAFGGRSAAVLDLRVGAADTGAPPHARVAVGDRVRVSAWGSRRAWRPGDLVQLSATLRRPRGFCNAGGDAFAERLWRRGVRWVASVDGDAALHARGALGGWRGALLRARAATAAAIDRRLPPARAAVLRALVVGDASGLPDDVREAYARTGTTHVLSVSGLHIAIVAGSAFHALRFALVRCPWLAVRIVPARLAALAALAPAAAYAWFAGGALATVRSLVMAAVFLAGTALAKPADLGVAIAAAALVIGLGDATAPLDASFQLSFGAVVAIVAGMRAAERSRWGWRLRPSSAWPVWRRVVARVLAATCVAIAAAAGTAPFTALHFASASLLGCFANLAIVPLVGWIAVLAGLGGTALLPCGEAWAGPAFDLAGAAIGAAEGIVRVVAALPGAAIAIRPPPAAAATAWLVGCVGLVALRGRTRAAAGALAVLAAAAALLRTGGAGELRLSLLDVGQGDAALVEMPEGPVLVVDAGPRSASFDPGAAVLAPAVRATARGAIDAAVLSHAQFDHYGGFSGLVAAVPTREFWSNGRAAASRSYAALEATLEGEGVARRSPGDLHPGSSGSAVELLSARDVAGGLSANDASLVLAVRYGAVRALFAGDLEARGEARLLADGGDLGATILKVPHHGSATSSSAALLGAVRPSLALAGIGARNRFGFPAAVVRKRYASSGALWRETGRHGAIDVRSDGQMAVVRTCRGIEE